MVKATWNMLDQEPAIAKLPSFVDLPTVSTRITGRQRSLLLADVKPCVCGSLTIEANFRSLADLPEFSPEQRAQQLEFEREQEQPHIALIAFFRRLNAIAQRGDQDRYRLPVNLFEARICCDRTAAWQTKTQIRSTVVNRQHSRNGQESIAIAAPD